MKKTWNFFKKKLFPFMTKLLELMRGKIRIHKNFKHLYSKNDHKEYNTIC